MTVTYPFPARYRQLQLSSIQQLAYESTMIEAASHTPERHANTRDAVKSSEATKGRSVAGLPQGQLTIAHPRKTRGGDTVLLTKPYGSAVLGALVSLVLRGWTLLSDIPYTQLLVSRCCDHHVTSSVPGQGLNNVGVLHGQRSLTGTDIPQLDSQVAGSRSQDVFRCRVEEDLSNLSRVASELGNGVDIGGLFSVGEEGEVSGDFPDHDLAIIRGRGNDAIVEGVP